MEIIVLFYEKASHNNMPPTPYFAMLILTFFNQFEL